MTELPIALAKRRDELAFKYLGAANFHDNYGYPLGESEVVALKDGFNLCYQEMAPLIEALEEIVPEYESIVCDQNQLIAKEALKKVRGNG